MVFIVNLDFQDYLGHWTWRRLVNNITVEGKNSTCKVPLFKNRTIAVLVLNQECRHGHLAKLSTS